MDLLYFLLMFACLGSVTLWYIRNDALRSNGENGLFAVRTETEGSVESTSDEGARYRIRPSVNGQNMMRAEKESIREKVERLKTDTLKNYRAKSTGRFSARTRQQYTSKKSHGA